MILVGIINNYLCVTSFIIFIIIYSLFYFLSWHSSGTPADLWAALMRVFHIIEEKDKMPPLMKADLRKKYHPLPFSADTRILRQCGAAVTHHCATPTSPQDPRPVGRMDSTILVQGLHRERRQDPVQGIFFIEYHFI